METQQDKLLIRNNKPAQILFGSDSVKARPEERFTYEIDAPACERDSPVALRSRNTGRTTPLSRNYIFKPPSCAESGLRIPRESRSESAERRTANSEIVTAFPKIAVAMAKIVIRNAAIVIMIFIFAVRKTNFGPRIANLAIRSSDFGLTIADFAIRNLEIAPRIALSVIGISENAVAKTDFALTNSKIATAIAENGVRIGAIVTQTLVNAGAKIHFAIRIFEIAGAKMIFRLTISVIAIGKLNFALDDAGFALGISYDRA